MIEYGWKQLSQWDLAPDDAYIKYVNNETELSKATCTYMLVEWTYQGRGVMRYEYVHIFISRSD